MRLLNAKTRKFEEFFGDNTPPYAILSHRWGDDEVTFQDIKSGRLSWRKPWSWTLKLEGCRLQAKKDNLSYIWVDTCCIDKTNSVELSEAINSMFNWYKNAARCYAYLSDVHFYNGPKAVEQLSISSWFTRGWTLQELLAPKEVHFYSSRWEPIGTKNNLSSTIEEVTGIPRAFLIGWAGLHEASVAQRMSWAANRVTTRTEDTAYCLLGLFDVTMPMIYGEKEQAFVRLQLEIMKNSDDHSILAWGFTSGQDIADGNPLAVPGGALATSPADFANSGRVFPCVGYKQQTISSFEFLGGSLRMQVPLIKDSVGQVFGLLSCGLESDKEKFVGIPLDAVLVSGSTDNYFRPAGRRSSLFPRNQVQDSSLKLIYISKDVQASESKSVTRRNCFYIDESAAKVKLIDVVPRDRWMEERRMITASEDPGTETREEIFLRFRHTSSARRKGGDDFVVVLVFERQGALAQAAGHVMILSRRITLAELGKEFKTIGKYLYGQQSCSNGLTGVEVSVKQETIAGQGVFVLKLTTLAETSGAETKTVSATQQLAIVHQQREDGVLLKRLNSERDLDHRELDLLYERLEKAGRHRIQEITEEETIRSAVRDAHLQLNDAQERVRKAQKLVDKTEKYLDDARFRRKALEKEMADYKNVLQEIGLRIERRQQECKEILLREEVRRREPVSISPAPSARLLEAYDTTQERGRYGEIASSRH